jgi:hypothetical protein
LRHSSRDFKTSKVSSRSVKELSEPLAPTPTIFDIKQLLRAPPSFTCLESSPNGISPLVQFPAGIQESTLPPGLVSGARARMTIFFSCLLCLAACGFGFLGDDESVCFQAVVRSLSDANAGRILSFCEIFRALVNSET